MGIIEAKDVFSKYFTGSEVFFAGDCWLYSIAINAASGGKCIVRVYDGSDDNGEAKFEVQCPADNHKHFKLAFPVYLRYGLYLDTIQNLRSGFVQVLPC